MVIIIIHKDTNGDITGTSEFEIPNVLQPYIDKIKKWLDRMFPTQKRKINV